MALFFWDLRHKEPFGDPVSSTWLSVDEAREQLMHRRFAEDDGREI